MHVRSGNRFALNCILFSVKKADSSAYYQDTETQLSEDWTLDNCSYYGRQVKITTTSNKRLGDLETNLPY